MNISQGVAVIILDRPPVNSLGHALRAHIVQELDAAQSDANVPGITRRPLLLEEVQRRALLAMVNEAVLLFVEGIASRPGDIDVVLVQGYGFPRWEGGPVFWAAQQHRGKLAADLRQRVAEAGHGFVPADLDPLLEQ